MHCQFIQSKINVRLKTDMKMLPYVSSYAHDTIIQIIHYQIFQNLDKSRDKCTVETEILDILVKAAVTLLLIKMIFLQIQLQSELSSCLRKLID